MTEIVALVRCNVFSQQCFLVQATARPKPSCHGEKLSSLQIAGFSHTYPRPKQQKKLPLSIANSRTAPGSSVHLPEISWNKIWKLWLWLLTFCLWIGYLNAVSELEYFVFMCWSKNFIFCILPAVGCELSNEMHSSRSSAMKQTARRAIGTECQSHGCGKMFGTMFSYDQHRHSAYLRGTACSALPNETRVHVTAAPRPSMSTAVVERRTAKRTLGGGRKSHILHIQYM